MDFLRIFMNSTKCFIQNIFKIQYEEDYELTPVDPAGEAGERSEDVPEETPVPDADSADSGVHIGN